MNLVIANKSRDGCVHEDRVVESRREVLAGPDGNRPRKTNSCTLAHDCTQRGDEGAVGVIGEEMLPDFRLEGGRDLRGRRYMWFKKFYLITTRIGVRTKGWQI